MEWDLRQRIRNKPFAFRHGSKWVFRTFRGDKNTFLVSAESFLIGYKKWLSMSNERREQF